MGAKLTVSGSFNQTEAWLKRLANGDIFNALDQFGQAGAAALAKATPELSGETAAGWSYEIIHRSGYFSIKWTNTHRVDGRPLAIMLQYGHGTRQGGYVEGQDYINPAIRPIFDQIDAEVRRVVMQ